MGLTTTGGRRPAALPRSFLVTGAAGGLGAEVCARLATGGHGVVAMVHRTVELRRNDSSQLAQVPFTGRPPGPAEVTTVSGDVTRPGFGLDARRLAELRRSIDTVIHCAAITDFGLADELYRSVNVNGTRHVLEFTREGPGGPVPLVHVSTAYVSGSRHGIVKESELHAGQSFTNSYEATKFAAESLVQEAAAEQPAVVVRPSIVVGTARTGTIRDFTNMYVMVRVLTRGLVTTAPGDYEALLDLVPVDYVADTTVAAGVRFDEVVGRTLHVVGRRPLSLMDFSDVMSEFPSFYVPRYVPPHSFDAARLPADQRRYYESVVKLYEAYLRRRPVFDAETALGFVGPPPAPSGRPFLRRLFRYCMRTGYLGVAPKRRREMLTG